MRAHRILPQGFHKFHVGLAPRYRGLQLEVIRWHSVTHRLVKLQVQVQHDVVLNIGQQVPRIILPSKQARLIRHRLREDGGRTPHIRGAPKLPVGRVDVIQDEIGRVGGRVDEQPGARQRVAGRQPGESAVGDSPDLERGCLVHFVHEHTHRAARPVRGGQLGLGDLEHPQTEQIRGHHPSDQQ